MPGQIAHATDSSRGSKGESKQPQPEQPQQQETPPEEEQSSEVPDGTTKEILSWVGDDKERAQAALDKENASSKPRSTLVDDLEKKLAEG